MASRGRGQRMPSFTMDAVRGDGLPPSVQQPTPVFPVMEQKPLPLTGGEEAEYLLALKQDFRGAMRSLPCFIQPVVTRRDVERYSDKYNRSEQMDRLLDWAPDWKRFPRELRVHVRKTVRDGVLATVQSPPPPPPQMKKKNVKDKEELLLKLESLEKKEEQAASEDEEGDMKKKQEEEAEGEEEYDEEEFEEETDYIASYFDNGEDFGGDSDDNMDEAIY
ncbi:DNA-directed RNA polymerase III subunit RPC7-like [Archocentrus centrarchus]|uniref:DNA-directed RNA polymerase III subunit RPC7-like n=1 Tax=Archocentrus centrarchus TaxID=63155 RepID=UPI0011E9D811|nr:DNA-directed RNA polymerase III subunit RPC7-like [Archocentrus centrarchus]XP_030605772.1 DNA-directed RNA polymerase III subunit RPC7-like [Archocentrus centrarchus]XP_030605773.1 DNA-directed RNA polymerase III subunit RPC7-like [Archocentrus centrarchus]